ncbi:hypothetical protein [Rhodanobacter sp. MP7CTX1]|uniref:hypothetical protein n=1 Tax=Rhodanobacter sp. MP7CTX1 TaxID=2723084 RepID=UPI001607A5F9|nr:hypothetical protein [Rhodanobacter sp. MP7CTX1]MBB6187557.1 hypothetical protein [Rhodanobacter sp. MP7CTX1]
MKFIPTYPSKVKTLKKQAKRLQREGAGSHVALLDRIAQSAGYDHWNHVIQCLDETEKTVSVRGIIAEIEAIVIAELAGEVRIVRTGPEATRTQPFVLFSTGIGDAWMLEPLHDRAVCLVWRGKRQSPQVRDLPSRIEIMWDGTFELRGQFFVVETEHPEIGSRAIAGFPLDQLRPFLEALRPIARKIGDVFGQEDAVALTPDVIAQLSKSGWEREQLELAARQGALYSPTRNTVLFSPAVED